jgi:hypothetical protein
VRSFAFPGIDTPVGNLFYANPLCGMFCFRRYTHSGTSNLSFMRVHCVRSFTFPGIDTQVERISVLCESTVRDVWLSQVYTLGYK